MAGAMRLVQVCTDQVQLGVMHPSFSSDGVEDNSVRSNSTATLNGRIGYKINARMKVELEGFNLTNSQASSIDYFYQSRRQPGGSAEDGIHFHPIESRSFRVSLATTF